MGATTWPVTIEIRINSNGAQTEIELYGKCISMGPVQLNNVKNNVSNNKYINEILFTYTIYNIYYIYKYK